MLDIEGRNNAPSKGCDGLAGRSFFAGIISATERNTGQGTGMLSFALQWLVEPGNQIQRGGGVPKEKGMALRGIFSGLMLVTFLG